MWSLRPHVERELPFPEESASFHVRTNSYGWRGDEPRPGAVLCLGDSTTFGWGVAEQDAWPNQLEARLGRPVTNGGVPGYSTFQGLAKLDRALESQPSVVVLGFLVRDAQLAPMADSARPNVGSGDPPLRLMQMMARARPAGEAPAGTVPRVSAQEYGTNLRLLVQKVRDAGAEPVLLAFPMQEPAEDHLAVLEGVPDVMLLTPTLPASAFFPNDPIHLTAQGNAQLATLVADALEE